MLKWLFLGFIAGLAFAYRKQIIALIENKKTISAGGEVVEGAQSLWSGLSGLWSEVRK